MRPLALLCLLAALGSAQTGSLGLFTNSDDIGVPPMKGSAEFDPTSGQYKITGSGTDIWGKADQFHYVWREISGDFAVTATARFLTDGIDHRKAAIMLRQTADADSPFVHLVIHGNGMPSLQFRTVKGEGANTVDMPILGTGTFSSNWNARVPRLRCGSQRAMSRYASWEQLEPDWESRSGRPCSRIPHADRGQHSVVFRRLHRAAESKGPVIDAQAKPSSSQSAGHPGIRAVTKPRNFHEFR